MKTKNSKRIVMIISQFYPLLGGAEVQVQGLASNLIKRGFKVLVLTRKLEGLPTYEVIEGIPVHRKIRTIEAPFLWGVYFIITVFLFLYRKRKDYDIIHCHIVQEYQTIVAVLFKYMFNKKVIVKMSSSGETSDLKMFEKGKCERLFSPWIRNVDSIISVCKESSKEILKNGFSREVLVEIPNGVDIKKFSERTYSGRSELKNITYIGRLDSYKGINILFEGFKKVLSKVDNVRLTIVGNGPDEDLLKKIAKDINIQKHVTFKGRQENVLSEYHSTDIFVLPSLSEGMSNVLLEAMSCGLPVVATSIGGNSDLIRDGHNGCLIPPRDSGKLGTVLLKLLGDEDASFKMGKEARRTIEMNYSMDKIVDKYIKLYKRLVL